MEIHLTPELEEQLRFVAISAHKDAEELVREVLTQMLGEKTRLILRVEQARASYARGEFLEEEEMDALIARNFDRECVFGGRQRQRTI